MSVLEVKHVGEKASIVTPLGIAVLALLFERPMHPYEMYQLLVQRREDRNVKVRPGSLYHTVDRLQEQKLVRSTGTNREGNRPERTTYEVTDSGRAALTARISEILATPIREYPLFPVALAEAHNIGAEVVAVLLRERIDRLAKELDESAVLGERAAELAVPRVYWLDVGYSRAVLNAEIEWLRGLVDEIENGALPWLQTSPKTYLPEPDQQNGQLQ